jgi:hypothetical protein
METLLIILAVGAAFLFLIGFASEDDGALMWGCIFLVFFLGVLVGGLIVDGEMRKEAVKTGNAHYKQVVDDNGNVKNEFHWANESKEKKRECENCGK